MNFSNLLLAVCCCSLFATVTARPASSSSGQCSDVCDGRNFWEGYEAGNVYNYKFTHEMSITSGLKSYKMMKVRAAGTAAVEVVSDCEMLLTVKLTNSNISSSWSIRYIDRTEVFGRPVQLPSTMETALSQPLRFSFQDGRIKSICPSSLDSRESLNFKRGILSHLNFGIDSADQIATVTETDILGSCWTEYKPLSDRKILKVKNLATCRNSFSVFPMSGVKSEPPVKASADQLSVQKGSVRCEVELNEAKDYVKVSQCTEERSMLTQVGEKKGEKVQTSSQLTFQSVNPAAAAAAASASPAESRLSLQHQHKSNSDCVDGASSFDSFNIGSECLEKTSADSVISSATAKEAAQLAADQLCKNSRGDNVSTEVVESYVLLLKSLRAVTDHSDVLDIYKQSRCFGTDFSETFLSMYIAALVNAGTESTARAAIALMQDSAGRDIIFNMDTFFMQSLASMPYPTATLIQESFNFMKKYVKEEEIERGNAYLALSTLVGKFCDTSPDCETVPEVKEVIDFFSEKLGENCSNLSGEKYDVTLTSLLSINNIGRISGGAQSLINCATNSKISVAGRSQVLQSLERFPSLNQQQMMTLNSLFASEDLDSEIRIFAFKILFKFADSKFRINEDFITNLSNLFISKNIDIQVKYYVYTYLKNWLKKTKRNNAQGSIDKIISNYEKILFREGREYGFGYSKQLQKAYQLSGKTMKLNVESNMIHVSNALLPRFVNLNLTVDSPLSGEAVNVIDLSVRAENLEKFTESLFNYIQPRALSKDELKRNKRQAATDLNEEQKKFQQPKSEMRLDFIMRRGGKLVSAYGFNDGMLRNFYAIGKGQKMGPSDIINKFFDPSIPMKQGGTVMESALVIPSITGFPILVKKEIHYATNIQIQYKYRGQHEIDISPKAAVLMSRTVAIDAAFERTGIQTKSKILSDTGAKLFATKRYTNWKNMKYQIGVKPLKKKQQLVDLQTDVVFFSHNEQRKINKQPVVSNDEAAPLVTKCSTDKSFEYIGAKFCEKSTYGNSPKTLWLFRQTPGQYGLTMDLHDDFEVLEFNLKVESTDTKKTFQIYVGDNNRPNWLNKIEMSIENEKNQRNLNFEFINPMFPIKWNSTSQTKGENRVVKADLKFGSIGYKFSGSRSKTSEGDWILNGNIDQVGSNDNPIKFACTYGYYGLMWSVLPMTRFDLELGFSENKNFVFKHLFKSSKQNINWNIESSYRRGDAIVSSYKSRIGFQSKSTDGQKSRSLVYDTEVKIKDGNQVQHSMSLKVSRNRKDYSVTLMHKFLHGFNSEKRILDFTAQMQFKDETRSDLTRVTGDGSIEFNEDDGKKEAKLSNFVFQLGNANDIVDSHDQTKTLSLSYDLNYLDQDSKLQFAIQTLPVRRWSPTSNCLILLLNVTNSSPQGTQRNLIHLRHAIGANEGSGMPVVNQIVSVIFANDILLNITHNLSPVEAEGIKYNHLVTGQYLESEKLQISNDYHLYNATLIINSNVKYGGSSVAQVKQLFEYGLNAESQMVVMTMQHNSTVFGEKRFVKFQQKSSEQTVQNEKKIMKYITNGIRNDFKIRKFAQLLWKYWSQLQQSQVSIIKFPTYDSETKTEFDMTQQDGICFVTSSNTMIKNNKTESKSSSKTQLNCTSTGSSWWDMSRQFTLLMEQDSKQTIINSGFVLKVEDGKFNSKQTFSIQGNNGSMNFNASMNSALTYSNDDCNLRSSVITEGLYESETEFDLESSVSYLTAKPFTNFGLKFSDGSADNIKLTYNLTVSKPNSVTPDQFQSKIAIINSFKSLPFALIESNTTFISNSEMLFSVMNNNSLDGDNVLSFAVSMPSQTSGNFELTTYLPALQVAAASFNYEPLADDFKKFVMLTKVVVFDNEYSYSDNLKMKVNGPSDSSLFNLEYEGVSEFRGLNAIQDSLAEVYKMPYSGLTRVKRSGEYDFKMSIQLDQDGELVDFAVAESQINVWPLNISSKVSSEFWQIGQYGMLISAGPREKPYSFGTKFQIQEPLGNHLAEYYHDLWSESGRQMLASRISISSPRITEAIPSDRLIEGAVANVLTLNASGSALYDMQAELNVKTILKDLSELNYAIEVTKSKQSVLLKYSLLKDGEVMTFSPASFLHSSETSGKNNVGSISIVLNEMILNTNYTFSNDYTLSLDFNSGQILGITANVKALWLSSAPEIAMQGLSVQNANLGLQVSSPQLDFYIFRSGDASAYKWVTVVKKPIEFNTEVNVANNKITSGSGSIGDQKLTFSSSAEGSTQISLASGEGSNSISWTKESDGFLVKFNIDDKESCAGFSMKQGFRDLVLKYGNCEKLTTLSWKYLSNGNLFSPNGNAEIEFNLVKPEGFATTFYLLPGVSFSINFVKPFSFKCKSTNAALTLDCSLIRSSSMPRLFSTKYDFTSFPGKANFEQRIQWNSKIETYIGFDYDIAAQKLDVNAWQSEKLNMSLNMTSFEFEMFDFGYVEASFTPADKLDVTWSLKKREVGDYSKLSLARQDIEKGKRFSGNFFMKDESVFSWIIDATDYSMNFPNFQISLKSDIRTTLHPLMKKMISEAKMSHKYDSNSRTYLLTYDEKLEHNGEVIYDLVSKFGGIAMRPPTLFNIDVRNGWMIGNFSYNLQSSRSFSSLVQVSKFGDSRDEYLIEYLLKDFMNPFSDFSLDFNLPNRNIFMAQSNKQLTSGAEEMKFEIFIHKTRGEGVVIKAIKDFTEANVYNRTLLIELPTRTVGYERSLSYEGDKTKYSLAAFWNYPIEDQSTIRVNFENQFTSRRQESPWSSMEPWTYYQNVIIAAPFLKEKFQKQMNLSVGDNTFTFSGSSSQGSDDSVNILMKYKRFWDHSKYAYQRQFNVTFRQQKNDINANLTVIVENKSLWNSKIYSQYKYLTEYRIYSVIPSQSIDSFVRIRSVPFEELSFACNHGATFAFRFYETYAKSRMTLFVSNSNKEAGQLSIVKDKLQSMWRATLDTGNGYVNPSSSLSIPFYEAKKTLVMASAGISKCGTKLHFGVVSGEIPDKVSYSLWKPQTINKDLDFFFVGLKLEDDNRVTYSSHWRLEPSTNKAVSYLKETLIDPWALYGNLPVDTSSINELLSGVTRSQAENVDTSKVLSILNEFSSNDMDKLTTWALAANERNDFFCNTVSKVVMAAYYTMQRQIESAMQSVSEMASSDWLPQDLGVQSIINKMFDVIVNAINGIPVSDILSSVWNGIRSCSDIIVNKYYEYLNNIDVAFKNLISSATEGSSESVSDLISRVASPAMPLMKIFEQRMKILEILFASEKQSIKQTLYELANVLKQFAITHIPDAQKAMEFSTNLNAEMTQWKESFTSMATNSGSSDEAEYNIIDALIEGATGFQRPQYARNLMKSARLLLSGDMSAAVNQFFRTDAYKVETFRLKCDSNCEDRSFYSAVNGTVYSPIYIPNFRPRRYADYLGRSQSSISDVILTITYRIFYYNNYSLRKSLSHRIDFDSSTAEVHDKSFFNFKQNFISNSKSCKLLLLNDFTDNTIRAVQSYTIIKNSHNRTDLVLTVYGTEVTITRELKVKVNNEVVPAAPASVTIAKVKGDNPKPSVTVEVRKFEGRVLHVYVHTGVNYAMKVKCFSEFCQVSVHPVYRGKLNGAFGSNEVSRFNSPTSSASGVVELWSMAMCSA